MPSCSIALGYSVLDLVDDWFGDGLQFGAAVLPVECAVARHAPRVVVVRVDAVLQPGWAFQLVGVGVVVGPLACGVPAFDALVESGASTDLAHLGVGCVVAELRIFRPVDSFSPSAPIRYHLVRALR